MDLRHLLEVLDGGNSLHLLVALRNHLPVILPWQDLGLFIRRSDVENGLVLRELWVGSVISGVDHLRSHSLGGVESVLPLLLGRDFLVAHQAGILGSILHLRLIVFVHDVILGLLLLNLAVVHSSKVFGTDFLGAVDRHARSTLTL